MNEFIKEKLMIFIKCAFWFIVVPYEFYQLYKSWKTKEVIDETEFEMYPKEESNNHSCCCCNCTCYCITYILTK